MAPWGPKGAQGSPKSDLGNIMGSFWEPSRSTFGVILPRDFQIGGIMSTFWCPFSGLRKGSDNRAPRWGGGHAIHPRRRMFREGGPSSLWLRFGLHFGVILEAKFATILLFGCAGPYFWVILEPFKTRVAFGSLGVPSGQVRPYWSHTWGKGGRA